MKICYCEIMKRWRGDATFLIDRFNDMASRGLLITKMENLGHVMNGQPILSERTWDARWTEKS